MRLVLIALSAAAALTASMGTASAQYGWRERSYDWDTRPRHHDYNNYYSERRHERYEGSRRSLRYYCGLGSQTPRSVRDDCRRAGYW